MKGKLTFEWDPRKAEENSRKHGVGFEESRRAFGDPTGITIADTRFEYGEDRFVRFGKVHGRLHIIVYAEREGAIRLISARKANKREQKFHADRTNKN